MHDRRQPDRRRGPKVSSRWHRRAVILPVILFILMLLGLLVAMFAFRVHADAMTMQTLGYRQQERMAVRAAVDFAKALLATEQLNMDAWYNNPELNRVIVWGHDVERADLGTSVELNDDQVMVYRFSLVADDFTDDEDFVRFGLTDESSKINLNTATEDQLYHLVARVTEGDDEVDVQGVVDAIIDWRDTDATPYGEAADTEGEYYLQLDDPYRIRNGPFDTVEELLLVKGMTGNILYGEDFDRNGLLTPNENDGDLSFPPDNEDDVLNLGLYSYLTVHSLENNVSNDNRQRVYLLGDEATIRAELALDFEENPYVIDDLLQAVAAYKAAGGRGVGDNNNNGGNGGGNQQGGGRNRTNRGQGNRGPGLQGTPGLNPRGSNRRGDSAGTDEFPYDEKLEARAQSREDDKDEDKNEDEGDPDLNAGSDDDGMGDDEQAGTGDDTGDGTGDDTGDGGDDADGEVDGETDDTESASEPIPSPAMLFLPQEVDGQLQPSPLSIEWLAIIMDRTTMRQSQERQVPGLVNINTAPRAVLECLDGLTSDQVGAILSTRADLDAEAKTTSAWLVTEEVLDLETYARVAPQVTARGQQFTIDALGFADHIGMVTRVQVVVDMLGPVAQTLYTRDLTSLGAHFPIREEDAEKFRVR